MALNREGEHDEDPVTGSSVLLRAKERYFPRLQAGEPMQHLLGFGIGVLQFRGDAITIPDVEIVRDIRHEQFPSFLKGELSPVFCDCSKGH